MCGIFGVIAKKDSRYNERFLNRSLKTLAQLSLSRGKDSSGLCLSNHKENTLEIFKGPVPISKLLEDITLQEKLNNVFHNPSHVRYAFGHARLVTNGTQLNNENNQPVVKDGIVAVHNGIIVNVDKLWNKYPEIKRKYDIDTEVLLSLIRNRIKQNNSLKESVSCSINEIFGTVSTAMVFDDLNQFVLATNNGSLYTIYNHNDILFFASERNMLHQFAKKISLSFIGRYELEYIKANEGMIIDLNHFTVQYFSLLEKHVPAKATINQEKVPINFYFVKSQQEQLPTVIDLKSIHLNPQLEKEKKLLEYPFEEIKNLKRCTKCLLPETFPFINCDEHGECNYCKNYIKRNNPKSIDELKNLVEPFRKQNGLQDVLIPYSGGRDSTYVIHMVKQELNLNPVAFTYDWGMVTDLARRNIARVCGKLGVENIIVAANIHWKRENIRKNIQAWLKKPDLGMVPLFMAGDKYFFYYAHKIKKQLGINLEIWGINELENTNFKIGFAGLKPQFDKKRIYSLSFKDHLKLFGIVGSNFLQSPGYINQSILDSLGSIASRYLIPKSNYYHLYDYVEWNEKIIENTIIENYGWEKAIDTKSTWRIGDGTASFYNYIYCTIAGFSENDTFRSNQIREGMISRAEALNKVYEENIPRYESLKWYLEIVGLDFETTIKRINQIPKLF